MRDQVLSFFGAGAPAAALAAVVSAMASLLFLRTRKLRYDALALGATEVGFGLMAASLAAGVIWTRTAGKAWWTWDARLTAALVCWLLYAAYLMLRHAIEEPTQRATAAAVVSVFAFLDIPIVVVAIHWWRARHQASGAVTLPVWDSPMSWTAPAMLVLGTAFTVVRFRREQRRREADARRRAALTV